MSALNNQFLLLIDTGTYNDRIYAFFGNLKLASKSIYFNYLINNMGAEI